MNTNLNYKIEEHIKAEHALQLNAVEIVDEIVKDSFLDHVSKLKAIKEI